METFKYIRKTGLTLLASLALVSCGKNASEQPETFSEAVEQVALHGGSVAISGFDCDFSQLDSDIVQVQRVMANEADFTGAIIADENGIVTEYGNVQCIILDEAQLEVRGSNGL